tara:strand:+ start:559 stop:1149 length:591 start_codon:yes stop_codon:yes gene_type:complete
MEDVIKELKRITENNILERFTFNLKDLPYHDNYTLDIRRHKSFSKIFTSLNDKRRDCLYWFSVKNKIDALNIKGLIENSRLSLRNQKDKRVVPAKNNNLDSNVIYVGVRKGGCRKYTIINKRRVPDVLSNIEGRIIQHLGYYTKGTTQGLQFIHWSNQINIEIELMVMEFKDFPNDYLYIIEKLYAISLKPLLGSH